MFSLLWFPGGSVVQGEANGYTPQRAFFRLLLPGGSVVQGEANGHISTCLHLNVYLYVDARWVGRTGGTATCQRAFFSLLLPGGSAVQGEV